jgi:hypothetical protein
MYIYRQRERVCVCVNWPPNPVVARYSRISWRPLIEKSSALGSSQWKVNSPNGSKMWHQLAVWCSLPTNEYKWCNWFTVPMIWVCPKIGYPKIIQNQCVLPQGLHPHNWTNPRLRCEDFLLSHGHVISKEKIRKLSNLSPLSIHSPLGYPWLLIFSSLSCDSWLRLRNEKIITTASRSSSFQVSELASICRAFGCCWRSSKISACQGYGNDDLPTRIYHGTSRLPWSTRWTPRGHDPGKNGKITEMPGDAWRFGIHTLFYFRPKIRLNYSVYVVLSGWWF